MAFNKIKVAIYSTEQARGKALGNYRVSQYLAGNVQQSGPKTARFDQLVNFTSKVTDKLIPHWLQPYCGFLPGVSWHLMLGPALG